MIGASLRYPLVNGEGHRALLAGIASLLAMAIGFRYAVSLYPIVLALAPAALSLLASLVLAGTLSGVLSRPDAPIPSLRRAATDGTIGLALAAATMALPVALLLGSVVSFSGLESALDSGAPVFSLLGSTSALLLFVAVSYALPAMVRGAVRTRRLRTATDRALLGQVLGSVLYLRAWTIGFPVLVLAWGLASVALTASTAVGVLAATGASYLLLVGVHVLGAGYDGVSGVASFEDAAEG